MRPEERFTKIVFGMVLIGSLFFSGGKWIVLVLGILFLVSAAWGICWSCKVAKLFSNKRKVTMITRRKK